ncbi:beta-lactamase/transpeptidase-like protein [Panaeolus papilionaceus]|nr:beta-lactamase/transpeptidase-like protein [Panaeolus papilionaceus]
MKAISWTRLFLLSVQASIVQAQIFDGYRPQRLTDLPPYVVDANEDAPVYPIPPKSAPLISQDTKDYVDTIIKRWNSTGLALAVVRRDDDAPGGWRHEFGSFGIARGDGTPMTPDTVFGIASNSKLFLAISVGLLISNKTLAEERGKEIKWSTRIAELIPEWGLLDHDMSRSVTIQDMLSHRTGMPRHDFSGIQRKGSVSEMIATLRYLRPSSEFRETFQYNNLMYETLSYLPQVLLGQTFESYIDEHLFKPLNMTSSTYSVAEAEARGTLADGFERDMQDRVCGRNGTVIPGIPYFQRPGEEYTWAGAGGVLTSARDLAIWASMLLNKGRHPYTNEVVVPEEVIEHVAHGRSITAGKPPYPEMSAQVYGAGQIRYSYQGHDLIEHGGSNPGFKTQVARFPDDNLGIISLSNDNEGHWLMEAAKFRVADELLGLKRINWNARYEKALQGLVEEMRKITPRPTSPDPPSKSFYALAARTFSHLTYGTLEPCLVPSYKGAAGPGSQAVLHASKSHHHKHCQRLLSSSPVERILSVTDLSVPTYIIPWTRMFASHLRLSHFSGNIFNVTVLWSNSEVREKEGYHTHDDGQNLGDFLIGFDDTYEVEWVHGKEEGLAFKNNFWGREGKDSQAPGGTGKDSAEVWFARD